MPQYWLSRFCHSLCTITTSSKKKKESCRISHIVCQSLTTFWTHPENPGWSSSQPTVNLQKIHPKRLSPTPTTSCPITGESLSREIYWVLRSEYLKLSFGQGNWSNKGSLEKGFNGITWNINSMWEMGTITDGCSATKSEVWRRKE